MPSLYSKFKDGKTGIFPSLGKATNKTALPIMTNLSQG